LGSGTDDRSGVLLNFINKSFVRRDGGNTVTGSIDMTGNTLNNVGFPTSERDVATKAYIDSYSAADKVSKSGDTLTGDLLVNTGSDAVHLTGCTDLIEGKVFVIAGKLSKSAALRCQRASNTMETGLGFLVKVRGTDVIQLGS